jgi:hypothetical protein
MGVKEMDVAKATQHRRWFFKHVNFLPLIKNLLCLFPLALFVLL